MKKSSSLLQREYLNTVEEILKDFARIHLLNLRKRDEFYQFLLPDIRSFWQRLTFQNHFTKQICTVVVNPLMLSGKIILRIKVFGEKFSDLVKWDLFQPLELTETLIPSNIDLDLTFELESQIPVAEDKRSASLLSVYSTDKRGKLLI